MRVGVYRAVKTHALTEADRKLLSRLVSWREGEQLQARSIDRLARALEAIEPGAVGELWKQLGRFGPPPAATGRWRRSIFDPAWLQPATGAEVSLFAPELQVSERRRQLREALEPGARMALRKEWDDAVDAGYEKRDESATERGERLRRREERAELPEPPEAQPGVPSWAFPDLPEHEVAPWGLSSDGLSLIEGFRKRTLRKGHDPWRVRFAIRRFFGPFCAWHRTHGVELGYHQLSRSAQLKALKLGLQLEEIWLGRQPWARRAAQRSR